MSHRRRANPGFTLIELMIAVACLGILTAGVMTTKNARLKVLGATTQQRHATAMLEAELERLRSAPRLPASGMVESPGIARLRGARARREVKLLSPGLARVELSLSWRDAQERRRKIRLVTLLAERKTR